MFSPLGFPLALLRSSHPLLEHPTGQTELRTSFATLVLLLLGHPSPLMLQCSPSSILGIRLNLVHEKRVSKPVAKVRWGKASASKNDGLIRILKMLQYLCGQKQSHGSTIVFELLGKGMNFPLQNHTEDFTPQVTYTLLNITSCWSTS